MTTLIDCRFVAIEPETAQALEDVGEELVRAGDMRGLKLLVLHLAWREAPRTQRIEFDPLDTTTHSIRADSEALRLRVTWGVTQNPIWSGSSGKVSVVVNFWDAPRQVVPATEEVETLAEIECSEDTA